MAATVHELYGGRIKIQFDESRHAYKMVEAPDVELIGQKIISATGALCLEKPALVQWAANTCSDFLLDQLKPGVALDEVEIEDLADRMKRDFRRISKKAASIGSLVHAYAEDYGRWKLGECSEPKLPLHPAAAKGCGAFQAWLAEHRVEFWFVERKVYSMEHHYCGTVDLIALVDGVVTIADYKTSGGVYDEYRAQIASYRMAADEEGFLTWPITQSLCLRFDKETGQFESHLLDNHEKDAEAFLHCLALRRWLDGNKVKR